ncbi:MAG: AMP-binding protein, partial [Steroidobacteraceae bacterium]
MNRGPTDAGLFEFGPDGAYLGYISDPLRRCCRSGVIVLGMGRRESRIARRLAALGLVVMQVQLFKDFADLQRRLQFYDRSGVAACLQAIDELIARRSVAEVILIGECAEGNLGFNTALVDARVAGMVLSNLNVLDRPTFLDRLPSRLFSVAEWRRLLTGDSKLRQRLLRMLGSRATEEPVPAQSSLRQDLVLPRDFGRKLSLLVRERGVQTLLMFSRDRDGLRYLRRVHGRALSRLKRSGRFGLQLLPIDAYDHPATEQSEFQPADAIADWAARALVPAINQAADQPIEQTALPDWSQHTTVVERFDAVAGCCPDQIALRDEHGSLTYAQLALEARRIAQALRAVQPADGPVAVLLQHEQRFAAALLGAWGARRVCLPLDADHPLERNLRIASHGGATVVVTNAALAAQARALWPAEVRVLDLDELAAAPVDAPSSQLPGPAPEDIACVIYTSGSTGVPKGVFQNHRGLLQDEMESARFAQLSSRDQLALFYPPSVIAGLRTLLSGLLAGATVHLLAPRRLGRSALMQQIRERGITLLRSSPTLFRHLADALPAGACFDDVRQLMLAGERVDWSDFDLFRRACRPQAQLHVHLGATECWTVHSEWLVDASVRAAGARLPVGRAIPGRPMRIVDEAGATLPPGEIGEAEVTSRHIALGYWRDPALTARVFPTDPNDPQQRRYRTGDLVRRRADGLVEFIGRKDNQIKLHGYRIEPNEIEAALKTCESVREAAVLVRCDSSGAPRALAGYVQLQGGASALAPQSL